MHNYSREFRLHIVRLKDREGLSFSVIAERLGMYRYQVRDLYHRIKREMKQEV